MKISACSIVKNEALNIGRSIESYKDAVDEIIIVDTGSTDNTVEVCKSLGAKVLHFEWCDDFSAAKNYALEHAKGDWVIFLDADEWFVPKIKRAYMLNILRKVNPRAEGLLTTFCDIDGSTGRVKLRGVINRIFKHVPQIKYYGSIHEKVLSNGNNMTVQKVPEIEIYHSGYSKDLMEFKAKRNLDLLYNLYNKGEINTELYFYLCRENCNIKNVDEAAKFYDLFMKQKDVDEIIKGKDTLICIYEVMYGTMAANPDRFSQVEIDDVLETAFRKYPELPLHSFLIGVEKLKAGEYTDSFEWISKAISLNKVYSGTYTNKFVGLLADAYFKLGYIRQKQGDLGNAISHFVEAIKVASISELPFLLTRVLGIIGDQPQEEIILFINGIIDISKRENIECILSVLKRTRLHKAFTYYAVKYNQEFDGQDETTYLAMMLLGQGELAVDTAIASNEYANKELANARVNNKSNVELGHNDQYYDNSREFSIIKDQDIDEGKIKYFNWQLSYAVIAILFDKRTDLYNKYKEVFNNPQREILEAYLYGRKIVKVTDELRDTFDKLHNQVLYLFDDIKLNDFRNIFAE